MSAARLYHGVQNPSLKIGSGYGRSVPYCFVLLEARAAASRAHCSKVASSSNTAMGMEW